MTHCEWHGVHGNVCDNSVNWVCRPIAAYMDIGWCDIHMIAMAAEEGLTVPEFIVARDMHRYYSDQMHQQTVKCTVQGCDEPVDYFSRTHTLCTKHMIGEARKTARFCNRIQKGGQVSGQKCTRHAMPGYTWCRYHLTQLSNNPNLEDLRGLDRILATLRYDN